MSITRGRIAQPHFITIYGQDGVCKTSIGAGAPDVLMLDSEKGTLHLDVAREEIRSYQDLDSALDKILVGDKDYVGFKSIVFDSLDWLVPQVYAYVCATVKHEKGNPVDSIEGYGFGKGYVHAKEVWQKLIAKMQRVREKGVNVILIAHAQVFNIDSPDTTGAYKQFDLKLPRTNNNDIPALFREACDAVLFASWKRLTPKDDQRALDGGRVLRTQHAPGWAAKNRFGLPEEIELPEFKRDAAGLVIPGQEPMLWAAYTNAVASSRQSGPDVMALLALAAQIPEPTTREKAIAAIKENAKNPLELVKYGERLKSIVSKGKDTIPASDPSTTI